MLHREFTKDVKNQRVQFSEIIYRILKKEQKQGNVSRLSFVSKNRINIVFKVFCKEKNTFSDLKCILCIFDERKSHPNRGKKRQFPPQNADIVLMLSDIKSVVSGHGHKTQQEKEERVKRLFLNIVMQDFLGKSVA